MNNNKIIVFDGHDGAGKSTLAKLTAEKLGGKYVCPFKNHYGIELIDAASQKNHQKTMQIGHKAINEVLENHKNQLLIFDRHWMTVLSLLPENYWHKWEPIPTSILCYANLTVTKARLDSRIEKKYDDAYHQYYLDIYLNLGKKFNTLIVNTEITKKEESLHNILLWINEGK